MIPGFKPQLYESITKLKEPLSFPKKGAVKLDGIRALGIDSAIRSRSLKLLPNVHAQAKFSGLNFFDGEFIVGPPNAPDVFNRTDSFIMSKARDDEMDHLKFYAFDYFEQPELPRHKRRDLLAQAVGNLPDYLRESVYTLPQFAVNCQADLDTAYANTLEDGYEGVMLYDDNAPYKFGRYTAKTQQGLKVKPFADDEGVIIAAEEAMQNDNEEFINEVGRTARSSHKDNKSGKGMIGKFLIRDLTTGKEFRISAGRMAHAERYRLWPLRESLVGLIVTYRHFTIGVKDNARHGRFLRFRNALEL